ncbi:MAG: DUF401 family protein [Bacillota bacterium]|nr:DUF401 family protein [Bacillota bacterium]MDW7730215.1 DUF401 family protein [Bacillota bacterium]
MAISIFVIIFLIRKGFKMYTVLSIAIIILAITNGNYFLSNIYLLYDSVTSVTAFYLVSMVTAIVLLGNLHQKTGAMEQLVDNLRLLIRDPRALLMIFPAAISLFSTVPGGAIISAPMVEETGKDLNMSPVELAMSNMVYRHLVVLITPFNASLVLVSGITGISIAGYLSFTVPVIAVVFIIATIILLIRYPKPSNSAVERQTRSEKRSAIAGLLIAASPYIVAIMLGLAFGVFFPLALLAGIVICFVINLPTINRADALRERARIFMTGLNWPIILSTLAIVVYKDFMLEAESFQQAVQYLVDMGLPIMFMVIALPFITGFITGNNTASLGIALPVLIPFLGPEMLTVRYFGLVYLSSYAGYLGSPVHLCTYLTNEYFKTPMYSLIKQINVYGIVMLAVGLLFSLLY